MDLFCPVRDRKAVFQCGLGVNRDIMVLANPEIAGLPNWVVALVAAGALAAALSTAAGLLLVISTAVAHDLLKRSFMPAITEKQELLYARVAIFVAVLVAGYVGINPPAYVAQVVAYAFGLAAASFFPAIVLGIFQKRMNKHGAIAGMRPSLFLSSKETRFVASHLLNHSGTAVYSTLLTVVRRFVRANAATAGAVV